MAWWRGAGMVSTFLTCPERERVKRNSGAVSDSGETIKRPLASVVMQIHEPSLVSAERSNSALKPGRTLRDSAGVALAARGIRCGFSAPTTRGNSEKQTNQTRFLL